jgi:hypothetical protein
MDRDDTDIPFEDALKHLQLDSKMEQPLGKTGDKKRGTDGSPIYCLHLKEIHNLNVTSDLAAHPRSIRDKPGTDGTDPDFWPSKIR